MPEKLFHRALVIRGGALGDFLLTLPVLRALHEVSETLEILAYPQFGSLARDARIASGFRSIEYGSLAGFFARGARQDPQLRAYFASFDVIISYLFDPDGIFSESLRSAGVKNLVIGPHKPGSESHAIDQLTKPLVALGISAGERAVFLDLKLEPCETPWLAIHPGSGSPSKNWPASRWNTLVELLLAEFPKLHLVIAGGEADRAALDALKSLRAHQRVEFLEDLPLGSLAKRLGAAQAYLGHDSGISHLAAVLGIPSLLLFGPTSPATWAPPHPQVEVLRAPDGNLTQLDVSTVLTAAKKHLLLPLLAPSEGRRQNRSS